MKKQQREKEQQERLAQKEKDKELRQKDIENDIANAGALAVVSSNAEVVDTGAKVSKMVMSDGEQAKAAAAAAADAAAANAAVESRQAKAAAVAEAAATILAERSSREKAPALLDEALVRKLFHLLDRSEKNAISKRDVLVALKKHAPVRVLFGLPAGSTGDGGDDLQARINAIQDAFEASSSLGELTSLYEELCKGGPSFAWDAFLAHCQQDSVRSRAGEALQLMPREHTVGASFEATYEWKIVPEGAACIAGLEYKMDMATGRTLGRLPHPKA